MKRNLNILGYLGASFLGIVFFVIPSTSYAAIAVTATSSSNCTIVCASLTFAHAVPASSNRLLVVNVVLTQVGGNTFVPISSVTYGGAPLTEMSSVIGNDGTANSTEVSQWYLVNPPVGTANVIVSVSGFDERILAISESLSGVNTSSPYRNATSSSNVATLSRNLFVTSTAGDLVLDVACDGSDILSVGAGQTLGHILNYSSAYPCGNIGVSSAPGSALVTNTWTGNTTDFLLIAGVSIKPVSQTLSKPPNKLGLVGYWSFDEGTGTQAGDYSGFRNTGVLAYGSPPCCGIWESGKFGKGLAFYNDGSGAYLDAGNGASLNLTTTGTISMWIKSDINAGYWSVVTKIDNATFRNGYDLGLESTCYPYFVLADAAGFIEINGTSISQKQTCDGRWHHIMATWDGSFMRLYVDGVLDYTPLAQSLNPVSNVVNLRIGKDTGGSGTCGAGTLGCHIDEVRIYNRALSVSEVAALYQSGKVKLGASSADLDAGSSLGSGLVGHWTFDGSLFTDKIYDSSGNNRNAYYINGATTSAKTLGKLGQAVRFNTGTDYVYAGEDAAYEFPTESFTATSWVKLKSLPGASGDMVVVSKTRSSDDNENYNLSIDNGVFGGGYGLTFYTDGCSNARYSVTPTLNQWYHMVGVYNSVAQTLTLYVDGVQQGQISCPFNPAGTGPLWFGRTHFLGGSGDLDGDIDDVRIYNRALSVAEIKQLYQLGQVKIK